jgi:predicted tellurium resistance membrane protein TerC
MSAFAGTALVALVQGGFYLLTGLWPLLHIRSFLLVTGPKRDLWLVKTVGVLVTVVGAVLLLSAFRGEVPPETAVLAIGCAVALAGVDMVYVGKRVIGPVYLWDAAAEAGLVLWWLSAFWGGG